MVNGKTSNSECCRGYSCQRSWLQTRGVWNGAKWETCSQGHWGQTIVATRLGMPTKPTFNARDHLPSIHGPTASCKNQSHNIWENDATIIQHHRTSIKKCVLQWYQRKFPSSSSTFFFGGIFQAYGATGLEVLPQKCIQIICTLTNGTEPHGLNTPNQTLQCYNCCKTMLKHAKLYWHAVQLWLSPFSDACWMSMWPSDGASTAATCPTWINLRRGIETFHGIHDLNCK